MASSVTDGDRLFDTTWVHLFEEDTAEGAVYGPEHEARLSRRPREQLTLNANGSAKVHVPGPDDRPVEQAATWAEEAGTLVVRARSGARLHVVRRSPSRLVVHSNAHSPTQTPKG